MVCCSLGMEKLKSHESQEKPKFLYHSSPNRSIEVFEPRVSGGSGEKYGAKVYATPDKALASIFLCNVEKPWSAGVYGGGVLVAKIPYTREEFIARDTGGTMYTLPSDAFELNEDELGGAEWTSDESVTPTEKEEYHSALEAMIENGVQVYFVDNENMKLMKEAGDGGVEILQTMQSENQRRGVNVKSLVE